MRVLVITEPAGRDGGSFRLARLLDALTLIGAHAQLVTAGVAAHLRSADGYDVVVLSRPDVAAAHIDDVRAHLPRALVVYDTVDLHFLREYRGARLRGSRPALERALARKQQELALVRASDRTLVVSELEREVLLQECPEAPVHVVSNVHDAPGSQRAFGEREGVLFVGAFGHAPNVDAAEHLLDDVWPRVRERASLLLSIVGAGAPAELLERAGDGVTVVGEVADVAPFLDASRVSIAPLRFGAGVKGKVLESLGRGVPVVATPTAVEGTGAHHGAEVLVGDSADDLAAAVLRLHSDAALWNELSAAGTALVAERYSVEAAAAGLAAALALEPARA